MSDLTDKIALLRKLHGESTAGPWCSDYCGDVWTEAEKETVDWHPEKVFRTIGTTARAPGEKDASFIAAAHNHLPEILAEVREVTAERDKLRALSDGLVIVRDTQQAEIARLQAALQEIIQLDGKFGCESVDIAIAALGESE
jgi:hypothetical protein